MSASRGVAIVFAAFAVAPTIHACGGGNTAGAGGSGGNTAGAGGSGGSTTGAAGSGGCPWDTGTTCANAVRRDYCCVQSTGSLGTIVRAGGFTEYEGRVVKAAIVVGMSRGSRTIDLSVTNGGFNLDAFVPDNSCSISNVAGGALFIDADSNGTCDPATDFLYFWRAFSGPSTGTCNAIDLTPLSPRCVSSYDQGDAPVLEAAQMVCPAVDNCLVFCPSSTGTGGSNMTCPTGGAGGGG